MRIAPIGEALTWAAVSASALFGGIASCAREAGVGAFECVACSKRAAFREPAARGWPTVFDCPPQLPCRGAYKLTQTYPARTFFSGDIGKSLQVCYVLAPAGG